MSILTFTMGGEKITTRLRDKITFRELLSETQDLLKPNKIELRNDETKERLNPSAPLPERIEAVISQPKEEKRDEKKMAEKKGPVRVPIKYEHEKKAPQIKLKPGREAVMLDIINKQGQTFRDCFFGKDMKKNIDGTGCHYDWWMFPVDIISSKPDYKVDKEEIAYLLLHKTELGKKSYYEIYLESIGMMLTAYEREATVPYPIRYSKMLHSLKLFFEVALKLGLMNQARQLCQLLVRAQRLHRRARPKTDTRYKIDNDFVEAKQLGCE